MLRRQRDTGTSRGKQGTGGGILGSAWVLRFQPLPAPSIHPSIAGTARIPAQQRRGGRWHRPGHAAAATTGDGTSQPAPRNPDTYPHHPRARRQGSGEGAARPLPPQLRAAPLRPPKWLNKGNLARPPPPLDWPRGGAGGGGAAAPVTLATAGKWPPAPAPPLAGSVAAPQHGRAPHRNPFFPLGQDPQRNPFFPWAPPGSPGRPPLPTPPHARALAAAAAL